MGDDPVGVRTRGLLRDALRHSGVRCAGLALASVGATGAGLALPAVLGRALDLLLRGEGAGVWLGWCGGLVVVGVVLDGFVSVLAGTVDARTAAFLRRGVVRQVLALGPRGRFEAGDLVARVVGSGAQAGASPAARAALAASVAGPVGGIVALGVLDPWLAVVFLAGAPVLALLLRVLARDTSECVVRYQNVQGRIAAALSEAVDGARTIQAAGTAERDAERVLRPLPELSAAGRRMWHVQGRAAAQAVAVAPLLQLGVVAVAGLLLARHRLSPGDVLAASRYAVLATGVGVLTGQLAGLVRARAGARRLAEVQVREAPTFGERRLPSGPGRLELRGVRAVRGDRVVLDGVDLTVPGGTTLAVVGRSGSGKSLLAAVAARLTDPSQGEVLLDGVPLHTLAHDALRTSVACAFERPALLGATIGDTIALGLQTPTDIEAAARKAQAHDFITRLPHGYATPCADAPHSGGESQRLGLARAFARPARLLVLDDALSSLDTITEHRITEALFSSADPTTRVVVAHRAATAARADAVAWVEEGRVRAVGRHGELWGVAEYRGLFGEVGCAGGEVEAGCAEGGAEVGCAGVGAEVEFEHSSPEGGDVGEGRVPCCSGSGVVACTYTPLTLPKEALMEQ
ncbi:ABC transporter ATP-binding protein, partial [Streptomyces sp. V2]|uniref:ATP-binding cassette domain-containing protein n=1 Tax=Streptomyces sp. V2 TaxID=1424099 RepID=UPI000D6715C5